MGHEGGHRRQEDQLAGGIGRSQQADDKPFACAEPPPGDIRRQKPTDEAGGQANGDTPQQNKLPGLGHYRGQNHA